MTLHKIKDVRHVSQSTHMHNFTVRASWALERPRPNWKRSCSRHVTDLAKLLHLLVCIGVQLLRDVLHPQQSSTVLGPRLLHSVHGEPRVRDGSVTERLHFLVQAAERDTQRQPTELRVNRAYGLLKGIQYFRL